MVLAVGGCMAFVTVDVRVDAAARGLRALSRELPGIGARVLTEFARASVPFVQRGMERAFDRPTPYTVSRVTAKFAERGNLRSVVGVPQSNDAAGRPKHEYLRPGALGAVRRNQKKTEFLLTRQGALPAGWIMTPGSFLKSKLDGYGNVPGSYYKQVIRSLQIRAPGDRYFKGVSKASAGRAAKMGGGLSFLRWAGAVTPWPRAAGGCRLGFTGAWLTAKSCSSTLSLCREPPTSAAWTWAPWWWRP